MWGGFTVAPQVLMPYGRLFNGSLGGARLDSASGLGDPILAAPVWLVNNPSTTFRPRALPVRPCRFLRCRAHAQRR
ncbi:QbdB protein [Klebsiella michiganensis]|uniref:QbdB protein n=1 Tax=Klebsiella michiganensis TaxID=1134687 RepID=A0A7H4MZH8_9ENTR|nr:QbdB protein [Klebsiella michiganensis]